MPCLEPVVYGYIVRTPNVNVKRVQHQSRKCLLLKTEIKIYSSSHSWPLGAARTTPPSRFYVIHAPLHFHYFCEPQCDQIFWVGQICKKLIILKFTPSNFEFGHYKVSKKFETYLFKFLTFWKPCDHHIQNLSVATFWILNFWQIWHTLQIFL